MTEHNPPALTLQNIATQTARLLEGLRTVEDIAREQNFTQTLKTLREKELPLDANAASQILQELMQNAQALKEKGEPVRAETFDGMRKKMARLDALFQSMRSFLSLAGDLTEAVTYDRDVALNRAQAMNSAQARDDVMAHVTKLHHNGLLAMHHALTDLMAMHVLLHYDLLAMEKMQEIDAASKNRKDDGRSR